MSGSCRWIGRWRSSLETGEPSRRPVGDYHIDVPDTAAGGTQVGVSVVFTARMWKALHRRRRQGPRNLHSQAVCSS